MDDVEQQLSGWGDEAMRASGPPVTAEEVMRSAPTTRPARWNSGRPNGGRLLGVAAAVAALIGLFALVAVNRDDGGDRLITEGPGSVPPTDPGDPALSGGEGPVRFEVLAVGPALMNGMGSVHSVGAIAELDTNDHELAELWADAGQPPPAPEVDLEDQLVLSITIPDDACPPELVGFDRREEPVDGPADIVIEPVFVEPPGVCNRPLIPKTFVVAVDWESVGDDFWLFLPGQPLYGFDDSWHRYLRDEIAGERGGIPELDLSGSQAVIDAATRVGFEPESPSDGGSGLLLSLPDLTKVLLTWSTIDAAAPSDPRTGLGPGASSYRTADGGNVTVGQVDDVPAVRFTCVGVRYQVLGARQTDGSPLTVDHLAPVASAMSQALGCTPVRTDAPTECLGVAGDPVACAED